MSKLIDTQVDGNGDIILTRNDVEIARVDAAGNVAHKALVSRASVITPSGWNANWAAKLKTASQPKLGIVGDSIARGMWTSSLRNNGVFGLVKQSLQAGFGDGGDGLLGSGLADVVQTTTVDAYNKIVCSAGITQYSGSIRYSAPGVSILQTTALSGSPQTFTFQGRGDSISIWSIGGSAMGSFSYTVDGVTAPGGPFSANGQTANVPCKIATTSGWGTGLHTVVVTVAAGQAIVFMVGGEFTNATGVLVHNFSTGGMASTNYTDTTKNAGDPALWNGGPSNPVDLLVYALGVNDCIGAVAIETYITHVLTFLHALRDTGAPKNGDTDLMIVMPHIGSRDSASAPLYASYVQRMRQIAQTYNAAFVDFWNLGRNSYANWTNLGYWSTDTASGGAGNSTIHPDDAGHVYMASVVSPLIVSTTAV